jgi:hypothetical protein
LSYANEFTSNSVGDDGVSTLREAPQGKVRPPPSGIEKVKRENIKRIKRDMLAAETQNAAV